MEEDALRKRVINNSIYLLCQVGTYFIGLLIYSFSPYYQKFISTAAFNFAIFPEKIRPIFEFLFKIIGENVHDVIWRLFYVVVVIAIYRAYFSKKNIDLSQEKGYIFWQALYQYFQAAKPLLKGDVRTVYTNGLNKMVPAWTKEQKTTVLYYLLKLFYAPLMLSFFYGNFGNFFNAYNNFQVHTLFDDRMRDMYFIGLNLLFTIDTVIFAFGYLFTVKGKSEYRSVDPYVTGWIVALMCYPPFNNISGDYLGWGSADYATLASRTSTIIMLAVVLLLYVVYVWASVALGFKASNLTNRGIVDKGPYKYIRHPAYITKSSAWIIMGVPAAVKEPKLFIFLLIWLIVYYLRALTEERHLLADPDYQAYCQKVKYRFIPYIY